MSWTDKLWGAYSVVTTAATAVKNRVIHSTAILMEGVGSVACVVGGAGVVLWSVWDESIEVSYYGGGSAQGNLNLTASIDGIVSSREMINWKYGAKKTGTLSYHLQDFVSPDTLLYYSKVLLYSGTALRFLGANLRCYRESRDEALHYKKKHNVDLPPPSYSEYLYVSALSVAGSLSCMGLSTAICGGIVDYSGLIGSQQQITYPSSAPPVVNGTNPSPNFVNTSDYQGPLEYTKVPIYSNFSEQVVFDVFGFLIKASANEYVEGVGELAYGAGVFFQSNTTAETLRPSILVATAVGASSLLAYSFFKTQAKHLRDDRVHQARQLPTVDDQHASDLYTVVSG